LMSSSDLGSRSSTFVCSRTTFSDFDDAGAGACFDGSSMSRTGVGDAEDADLTRSASSFCVLTSDSRDEGLETRDLVPKLRVGWPTD
jgi:hypothetical protein